MRRCLHQHHPLSCFLCRPCPPKAQDCQSTGPTKLTKLPRQLAAETLDLLTGINNLNQINRRNPFLARDWHTMLVNYLKRTMVNGLCSSAMIAIKLPALSHRSMFLGMVWVCRLTAWGNRIRHGAIFLTNSPRIKNIILIRLKLCLGSSLCSITATFAISLRGSGPSHRPDWGRSGTNKAPQHGE
jgi:hypothetical protein